MGVRGLWQLLECVGRPVTLESLENKVLGVDASLILNQSVKGMRDKHGNPVRNAHLVGLFNRVCKLLYYRIKPVFVFDGGVPHLKKKTLEARKERRFKAIHGSNRAAEKIVKNYLKARALETVTGRKSTTTIRSKSPRDPDVFELPLLPSTATAGDRSSSDEEDIPLLDHFCSQQLEEAYQDPAAINIESEDFKALPSEIQHELIKEIKEERKWMNKHDMPRQAGDFSSFQLVGVLKRGKMNQRLDELRRDMNSKNSGDLVVVPPDDSLGENAAVKSQKILSEDSAHYILIKNNGQAAEKDQHESGSISKDFSSEGGFFRDGQDCEVVSWTNPHQKPAAPIKPPSFDIPEFYSSDSEMLSPLLDVPEAGFSPNSPQAKKSAFSFSPAKENKSSVDSLVNVDDSVKGTNETPKQPFKSTELGNKVEESNSEESKRHKACDLQEQGTLALEENENVNLIAQIMNKKKELDDLIKKWEDSKILKTEIDLTSSKRVGSDGAEDKELSCLRSEALENEKASEKEQEVNTEETENSESAVVTEDQSVGQDNSEDTACISDSDAEGIQDKTKDTVCISNSDSEGSSVEEITSSFKPNDSVLQPDLDSCDVLKGSQSEAIENIQDELVKLSGNHNLENAVKGATEFKPVFPDVVMETIPSEVGAIEINQEDIHLCQEESSIGVAVDEQQAGPSGLPVEWQGATMENLEEIQMDIETEQKTLATEQARQSRIAASVSNEMFSECQELLQLFGVPYLVSPMEAEAQCAALDQLNLTEGSITDDSDIFLFGGTRVYKNIFNQQKHAELYASESVQRDLALNRSNLICFAFITGSDYTEGIQGVGPVGAMELLHEFSGEGFEGLKKFKVWHDETQQQKKAPQETKVKRKMRSVVLPRDFPSEEVFEAYLHPVVDESTEQFEWGKPDLHSLRLFACDKLGWSSARTDELLLPVMKQLNRDETQLRISQFFQVNFQETRNIKSKRIRRVLNRKFNPSSGSDNENGNEINGKKKKSGHEPSKTTKHKQGRNIKRSQSTEINSKDTEETESNVNRRKRAKGENTESDARSSLVNRVKGSSRGRGRGRHKLRKNHGGVHSKSNMELSVEITPLELSCPEKSLRFPRIPRESSRRGCGQHATPQPLTSADNKTEGSFANISTNGEKAGSSYRGRRELAAQDTSDSTDSDVDNVYTGPKPVSVFRRERGGTKGNGRGRGEQRRSLPEKDTSIVDSTDYEENASMGPKPVYAFRKGRGRGKGNRQGRDDREEGGSLFEQDTSNSDSTDNEDNDYAGPQLVSVSRQSKPKGRGRGRGRGRGSGRGKGRGKGRGNDPVLLQN